MASFFRKSIKQNYDFLTGFSWYTKGVSGMFVLLGWFLVGGLLGSLVSAAFVHFYKGPDSMQYATLVSYPIMFIPPMIYSKAVSMRNMAFDTGYLIDNDNFAPHTGWFLAALCAVATIASAFCMDYVNHFMPPMPQWLEDTLTSMTSGNLWVDILAVSIFAPLFEEWFCRGMILRGLLNYEKKGTATGQDRGMKPAWAIVISALLFALIHMNPWQAVPAFFLGVLFGYVYYRTGSLKLTMLMHCANNSMAIILSRSEKFKDADSLYDALPPSIYWPLFLVAAAAIVYLVYELRKIPLKSPQGNCDEIQDTYSPLS